MLQKHCFVTRRLGPSRGRNRQSTGSIVIQNAVTSTLPLLTIKKPRECVVIIANVTDYRRNPAMKLRSVRRLVARLLDSHTITVSSTSLHR